MFNKIALCQPQTTASIQNPITHTILASAFAQRPVGSQMRLVNSDFSFKIFMSYLGDIIPEAQQVAGRVGSLIPPSSGLCLYEPKISPTSPSGLGLY
jgi:hypothetical protein